MFSATTVISYRELNERVSELTHVLEPYPKACPVMVDAGDPVLSTVAALACASSFRPYLPADPGQLSELRESVITDLQVGPLVIEGDGDAVVVDAHSARATATGQDLCAQRAIAIFRTSGTTGTPKFVVHSLDSVLMALWNTSSLQHQPDRVPATAIEAADDLADRVTRALGLRFLSALPMSVIGGFNMALVSLVTGESVIVTAWPSSSDLIALASALKPTTIGLAPVQARQLERAAKRHIGVLPQLAVIGVGGGDIDVKTLESLESLFGCVAYKSYGMTEAGGPLLTSRWYDPANVRHNSVGGPVPGVEVDLRPDDSGDLSCGLVVRSRSAGVCYFTGSGVREPIVGPDGWLVTGDIAEWTEEGSTRIVGRRGHEVVRGGRRIRLEEVEQVLESFPGVERAAVSGFYRVQVIDPDLVALYSGDAHEEELVALSSRSLPAHMVPSRFLRVGAIPLARDGGVDRRSVKALVASG